MLSLPEEGAELGRLLKIVCVESEGRGSVATCRALAALERLVHAFALLEGLSPVDELIAI